MAQLAEEFIHNFYHIEGDTIAKRRKKIVHIVTPECFT
jgi:hypothetical protein